MKFQLVKKNQLLTKIKVVLEKTAAREKSLMEQVRFIKLIIVREHDSARCSLIANYYFMLLFLIILSPKY